MEHPVGEEGDFILEKNWFNLLTYTWSQWSWQASLQLHLRHDASYQVLLSFSGFIALCQDVLVDVVFLVLGMVHGGFLVAFRS